MESLLSREKHKLENILYSIFKSCVNTGVTFRGRGGYDL